MKKIIVGIVVTVLVIATLLFIYIPKKTQSVAKAEQEKTLIVGTNSEFPPFAYLEKDRLLAGFEIDLTRRIGERMGKTVVFKDMPFDALIPEIQTGNIHVIAAGVSSTPEREKKIYFSTPTLQEDPLVMVTLKEVEPLENVAGLRGKTVVVNEGYVADKYVSTLPDVTVYRVASSSVGEALLALQSKRADVMVASLASIKPFLATHAGQVAVTRISGTSETIALAISHHYPELVEQINTALAEIKKDGTLDILQHKWFNK